MWNSSPSSKVEQREGRPPGDIGGARTPFSRLHRFGRLAGQARFFTYRWRLFANAERFLPTFHGRVLDIGAERQPFRPYLPANAAYIALDVVPALGLHVVGNTLALPFAANTFDGIVCTEVLEHVPEPEQALREIARVLRPGGRVYVTVPMTWGLHYVPHDYYRFTRYGMSHLLTKAGLEVEAVVQIGGLFTTGLARLQDVLGLLAFRIGFPLKFVIGTRGREWVTSLLLLPFFVMGDILASALDRAVPRARNDALGWSFLARKP